jgi:hypothetical protein
MRHGLRRFGWWKNLDKHVNYSCGASYSKYCRRWKAMLNDISSMNPWRFCRRTSFMHPFGGPCMKPSKRTEFEGPCRSPFLSHCGDPFERFFICSSRGLCNGSFECLYMKPCKFWRRNTFGNPYGGPFRGQYGNPFKELCMNRFKY